MQEDTVVNGRAVVLLLVELPATLSHRKTAGREGTFMECLLCAMHGWCFVLYLHDLLLSSHLGLRESHLLFKGEEAEAQRDK